MSSKYADLHVHTNASDSTFSIDDVVENALSVGLSCVGITDHDTVDSLDKAMELGKIRGLEIVPEIEMSCEEKELEVHVLGYFIDWKDPELLRMLKILKDSRMERAKKIVSKLNSLNVNLTINDVLELTGPNAAVGRLHIAMALKKKGMIANVVDAFRYYIGQNGPAYERKYFLSPEEVINMIHKAGGLAVLAHPGVLNNDELVDRMIKAGLDGLEVYHTEHNSKLVGHYRDTAEKNNLLITGGSDCHGLGKNKMLLGTVLIPYEYVERLKKASKEAEVERP